MGLESVISLTKLLHDMQDPKLLAALQENRKRQAPYCGAFLLKDEPGGDTSASETEKSVHDIKGKELFNRLHEVGTLAQVSTFFLVASLMFSIICVYLKCNDIRTLCFYG